MTQTDSRGNINWRTGKGLVDVSAITQQIQSQLSRQLNVQITVDCGSDRYKVAIPGSSVTCNAKDQSRTNRPVDITVVSNDGQITWRLR